MDVARSFQAALREGMLRFYLRDVEERVASRSAEQTATIARLYASAKRRLDLAASVEPDNTAAAMPLLREAAALFIAAMACAKDPSRDTPLAPAEAWAALDALDDPRPKPAGFDEARAVLASADPLAVDALPRDEVLGLRASLADATDWLAKGVEPRTVPQLRRARLARQIVGSIVGAVVLYTLGSALFSPANIARGKRVTASSVRRGGPDVAGLVNGEYETSFGVHTDVEASPWVMVDLGEVVPLKRVKVYNRGDGWQNEMVPMTLELSDDMTSWTPAGQRTEVFTRTSPWVADVPGRRARYVRLALHRHGYIALTELEVY